MLIIQCYSNETTTKRNACYCDMRHHLFKFCSSLELCRNIVSQVMPSLRRIVADLSLLRPRFAPRSVHMRLVVDKIALRQVCLWALWFYPVIIVSPWLSILIYDLGMNHRPLMATVGKRSLNPSTWTCTSYWLIDYDGVRLCLRIAATNGPIVPPQGDDNAGWVKLLTRLPELSGNPTSRDVLGK
jgi:hypothetical protein